MGCDQFFDDGAGTGSWSYGHAFERRNAGENGYAGFEYSLRDLTVPAFSPASGSFIEGSIQERFARAYLHSTLTTKFALSAEYQMSRSMTQRAATRPCFRNLRRTSCRFKFGFLIGLGSLAVCGSRSSDRKECFETKTLLCFLATVSFGLRIFRGGPAGLPRRWGIASVDIRNLLDRHFRFQDTNPNDATLLPQSPALMDYRSHSRVSFSVMGSSL